MTDHGWQTDDYGWPMIEVVGVWDLELWAGTGSTRKRVGYLRLKEVQCDPVSGTIGVEVEGPNNQTLATFQIVETEARVRPWQAALVALRQLYGAQVPKRVLRASDHRCNGTTVKGRRCRVSAVPGTYYCQGHDPLREGAKP